MVIYKFKSTERKGDQQWEIICDCIKHWRRLNNDELQYYQEIMNMIIYRWNNEHDCWIALTYHLEPNKW